MKILHVVNLDAGNQYIDLLYEGIKSINENVLFSVDAFFTNEHFDIIHFHWPEALTNWELLSAKKEKEIELLIKKKRVEGTKIIYTLHNLGAHQGVSKATKRLYSFLERISDGIIHLGKFSYNIKNNNLQNHIVIPHHNYDYCNNISLEESRNILNIKKDAFVVLVFGKIRTYHEQKTILKFYKHLKIDKKTLLVPRWGEASRPLVKHPFDLIRFYLTKAFVPKDLIRKKTSGFINNDDVQLYFNSADIIFIPRTSSINSGILPLAYTFSKPVIGFNNGNSGVIIKDTNNFLLNNIEPNSIKNLSETIKKTNLFSLGIANKKITENEWDINHISDSIYTFYESLI